MTSLREVLPIHRDHFVQLTTEEAGREMGGRVVTLSMMLVETVKTPIVATSDICNWARLRFICSGHLPGLMCQVFSSTVVLSPAYWVRKVLDRTVETLEIDKVKDISVRSQNHRSGNYNDD